MVDMEVVMDRVLKGAYTGVGAILSGSIGNLLEQQTDNGMAIGAGEVVLGGALSIGVDQVFDNPESLPNDAIEHIGYGIQSVGWDEIVESTAFGQSQQTGAEVINVRSNATKQREKQEQQARQSRRAGANYSIDTA